MPRKDKPDEDEQIEQAASTEEATPVREAAPSHAGLVKMKKDDRFIHAHPTTVKDHQKNGWKLVG
jgi:hypothetical protein